MRLVSVSLFLFSGLASTVLAEDLPPSISIVNGLATAPTSPAVLSIRRRGGSRRTCPGKIQKCREEIIRHKAEAICSKYLTPKTVTATRETTVQGSPTTVAASAFTTVYSDVSVIDYVASDVTKVVTSTDLNLLTSATPDFQAVTTTNFVATVTVTAAPSPNPAKREADDDIPEFLKKYENWVIKAACKKIIPEPAPVTVTLVQTSTAPGRTVTVTAPVEVATNVRYTTLRETTENAVTVTEAVTAISTVYIPVASTTTAGVQATATVAVTHPCDDASKWYKVGSAGILNAPSNAYNFQTGVTARQCCLRCHDGTDGCNIWLHFASGDGANATGSCGVIRNYVGLPNTATAQCPNGRPDVHLISGGTNNFGGPGGCAGTVKTSF